MVCRKPEKRTALIIWFYAQSHPLGSHWLLDGYGVTFTHKNAEMTRYLANPFKNVHNEMMCL